MINLNASPRNLAELHSVANQCSPHEVRGLAIEKIYIMAEKKKDGFFSNIFKNFGQSAASSVAGSLGSIFSGLFQNYQYKKLHQYQMEENAQVFQQNKDLAAYTNQLNLDQWNRENAYNAPSAQMSRFAAAGLNPDLIYGQSNQSASSPTLSGGTPQNPTNLAALKSAVTQQAAQLQQTFAQTKLLDAQARNINADTEQKQANTEGIHLDNAFNSDTLEARKDVLFSQGSLLFEQIGLTRTERATADQLYRQCVYETLNFAERYQAELSNLNEDALNKRYQRALQDKQFQFALEQFAEQVMMNEHTRYMDKAKLKQETQRLAQAWTALMFQQRLLPYQISLLESQTYGNNVSAVTNYLNGVINRQVSAATLTGINLQNAFNQHTFGVRVNMLNTQDTSGRIGLWQQGFNAVTAPIRFNIDCANTFLKAF